MASQPSWRNNDAPAAGHVWVRPSQTMRQPQLAASILAGLPALVTVTGLFGLATVAGSFLYAPADAIQGNVQRIFYIHAPMALCAYLAGAVVAAAGLAYLFTRNMIWDVLARCSAEVAVVFTSLVLLTGSLWGKPVWGTWWAWDARLTTTLILWFIYVGYLMLRSYIAEPERAARYSVMVGVLGAIDIPLVHVSVPASPGHHRQRKRFSRPAGLDARRVRARHHYDAAAVRPAYGAPRLRRVNSFAHPRSRTGPLRVQRKRRRWPAKEWCAGALPRGRGAAEPTELMQMEQNLGYLFAAFAVTWAALCLYVFSIQRTLLETRRRLAALEDDLRRPDVQNRGTS
jgi:CcmD family protein